MQKNNGDILKFSLHVHVLRVCMCMYICAVLELSRWCSGARSTACGQVYMYYVINRAVRFRDRRRSGTLYLHPVFHLSTIWICSDTLVPFNSVFFHYLSIPLLFFAVATISSGR